MGIMSATPSPASLQAPSLFATPAAVPERAPSRQIEGAGTPDATWQAWGGLATLPSIRAEQLVRPGQRAVIIAPHPDDEVLACGGLLQLLFAQDSRILLVAVTDGDASHPGSTLRPPALLAQQRIRETAAALDALGLGLGKSANALQVLRARLPDGGVAAHIEQLYTLLQQILRAEDVVFVTSRGDGHPDHEACGLAAAMASRACSATLVEMPVWSWHWAAPGDPRLPWGRARRLDFGPDIFQRKRQAVTCFDSQLHPDSSNGQPAVLPPHVLARLLHPYEVYFL